VGGTVVAAAGIACALTRSLDLIIILRLVQGLGIPALTAPFVLATWIVLALGKLESACLNTAAPLSE